MRNRAAMTGKYFFNLCNKIRMSICPTLKGRAPSRNKIIYIIFSYKYHLILFVIIHITI